ncbi:DUF3237 domain-containing protein [Bacillus sp. Marseille-P3661]|uniref:DUF3237 domain-containing protein n=1 Tax=Bacillus sp. Marseille-P3661 TaxID=1936234 RepID=UPI000C85D489|nr:DUF3237 domain-containing protein [Bacillus sp. Marseille-P3661]
MSIEVKHCFDVYVKVDQPIEVGSVGSGQRRVIPITGGTFEGELFKGKILPGGADYQIIRPDGVTEALAHYTLQTEDGTNIYVVNRGYRHGPKEIIEKLIKGEQVPADSYYFKTTPTFEVSGDKYSFLNKSIFIGVGTRNPSDVKIQYYEVL